MGDVVHDHGAPPTRTHRRVALKFLSADTVGVPGPERLRREAQAASRLSHTQFPSDGPYVIVIVGILSSVLVVAWLIGRLNNLYIRITGTNRLGPIRPTWLRSMRDTTPIHGSVTVVEAVLMSSVMLAALALTIWFFLLAGSPIPNQ